MNFIYQNNSQQEPQEAAWDSYQRPLRYVHTYLRALRIFAFYFKGVP